MKRLFSISVFAACMALVGTSANADDPSEFPVSEIATVLTIAESADEFATQFHGQ